MQQTYKTIIQIKTYYTVQGNVYNFSIISDACIKIYSDKQMSYLLIFLFFIIFSPPYLFRVPAGFINAPIQTQLLISETFPNENGSMLHFFSFSEAPQMLNIF
jgi:hypothetical protein